VLQAQIRGYTTKKVLMDGGSNINLIYVDTLQKMKIPLADLLPSKTSFHGIVPGKPIYPLGLIHLHVIFGNPSNFREEKLSLKSSTGPLSTMPSSGIQHSPGSWKFRITCS
jgi:hypothetical protein